MKSIMDDLPIQSYTRNNLINFDDILNGNDMVEMSEEAYQEQFYKKSDLESLIEKLATPANIAKVIKAYTFGGKVDLRELLK